MEIKVAFRGKEIGHIDFDIFYAIAVFRSYGYGSFAIRSLVKKYDYFAFFRNDYTEEVICLYPDGSFTRSFTKSDNSKVPYDELLLIKEIIDRTKYNINNEEESD